MHGPGRNGHWKAAEKCPEDCCSETSPLLKTCHCFLKASVSSKCTWQPRVDVTAEVSWHLGAGGVRAGPGCPCGENVWRGERQPGGLAVELGSGLLSGFAINSLYKKSFSFFYLYGLPAAGNISICTCMVLCTMRL